MKPIYVFQILPLIVLFMILVKISLNTWIKIWLIKHFKPQKWPEIGTSKQKSLTAKSIFDLYLMS